MNEYRVSLQSKESWLKLHKTNVLSYDVFAFDKTKARIKVVQLNNKELGENDYCVIRVIKL